jgi:hypothetical protein
MCFSLEWLETILIWIVIIGCVIAILKLLVPWVVGLFGFSLGPLPAIVNYVILAVICIFVIIVVFTLIQCVLGMGGSLSLLPRHS